MCFFNVKGHAHIEPSVLQNKKKILKEDFGEDQTKTKNQIHQHENKRFIHCGVKECHLFIREIFFSK